MRIAKNCAVTYPGVAGGLFLVGGVLGGGGGVHGEAVHPRPSPPSSLSHPHHTGLFIPHTLRHRREVLLRTLPPRRVSAESSSSALSMTAQRFSGKFLSAHSGTDPTKVLPHTGKGKSAHTLGQLAEISHT